MFLAKVSLRTEQENLVIQFEVSESWHQLLQWVVAVHRPPGPRATRLPAQGGLQDRLERRPLTTSPGPARTSGKWTSAPFKRIYFDVLHFSSELVCRVKYNNSLPDLPFDPKFITCPFGNSRFTNYVSTTLEQQMKYDFITEQDLGVHVDLILPDAYAQP